MNEFETQMGGKLASLDSRMKRLPKRIAEAKRLQLRRTNLLSDLRIEIRKNRGIELCSIDGNIEEFAKRHASKRIQWNTMEKTVSKRIHETPKLILMKLPLITAGKLTINWVPMEGVSSEEFDGILSSISIASSVESILTKKVHSFDIPK